MAAPVYRGAVRDTVVNSLKAEGFMPGRSGVTNYRGSVCSRLAHVKYTTAAENAVLGKFYIKKSSVRNWLVRASRLLQLAFFGGSGRGSEPKFLSGKPSLAQ